MTGATNREALVAQPTYTFSFAGYLLSVAAGCVVVGVLGASWLGMGTGFALVIGFFALMFGLLLGMALFLPVVLLSVWLGNRLRLRSALFASTFGALGAALYSVPLLGIGTGVFGSLHPTLVLATAGAAAGYVYFLTERVDRKGRKRPAAEAGPPPDHDQ